MSWRRSDAVSFFLIAVCALVTLGCGEGGPSREKVTGTVTFDGQPLESGDILFLPANGGGTPEGGKVTNGKFEFQALAGPKRVEITATREDAKPAADGLPNYVSFIPKQYNSESTLTQTVAEGGGNDFVFDLTADGR